MHRPKRIFSHLKFPRTFVYYNLKNNYSLFSYCLILRNRFGRRLVFVSFGLVEGAAYLASSFMSTYGWFVTLRVVMGFANLGFSSVIWLLGKSE